jgi:hypothetical protein
MPTKTHFIGIFAFLYLLAAGVAFGLVLYEVYASGKELEDRVSLIGEQNAKVKLYNELSRTIDESKVERLELSTYVLTEDKTSAFLTELEQMATSFGVALKTLSLTVVNQEGAFDKLSIEFNLEGSESAVKKMLSLFETLPYHSRIESLRFAQGRNGNTEGTVKLSVTLHNYDQ